jgi:hypothetical protein
MAGLKELIKNRSFGLAVLLTFVFLGTGVAWIFIDLVNFSWVLFLLLPILLGFSIGALPSPKAAFVGGVFATLILLLGLWSLGLSGFLCVVMTAPLIICLIFIAGIISYNARKKDDGKKTKVSMLFVPLSLFMIAGPMEKTIILSSEQVIEVKTERLLPYSPEQVFDAIKSVDTLDAPKPFLMKFDLPVPTKCILEKEEIGALRTCYFDGGNLSRGEYGGGTITERITAIERGKLLKMDVVEYELIGRKWLGFKEAIYYFEKAGQDECKIIRITTYTSILSPRFYWEPLEKLGIQQEHQYVLDNLEKDLQSAYNR